MFENGSVFMKLEFQSGAWLSLLLPTWVYCQLVVHTLLFPAAQEPLMDSGGSMQQPLTHVVQMCQNHLRLRLHTWQNQQAWEAQPQVLV